jgi:hypothetical protein
MSGGFPMGESLALWVILAARAVSSILYVRTRLRLERTGQADRVPSWVSHLVGLAAAALLALAGLAPWLAVILMLVLTVRAGVGLSPWRRRSRPPIIGLGETAYGLLTVLLVALGYALQL